MKMNHAGALPANLSSFSASAAVNTSARPVVVLESHPWSCHAGAGPAAGIAPAAERARRHEGSGAGNTLGASSQVGRAVQHIASLESPLTGKAGGHEAEPDRFFPS